MLLTLALQGCNFVRAGGSSAFLNSATDADTVVDFISDEGHFTSYGFAPSGDIVIPGFTRVVDYRLYFHLDNTSQTAILYRIEEGWSRKPSPLPQPTSVPPAPRDRVLLTSDAVEAPMESGAPPDLIPRGAYRPYAVDAQKADGKWLVLRRYDPGYDDFSLYCEGKRVATFKGAKLGLNYFTWDGARQYIVFCRGIPHYKWGPSVPEIDVWHYDRPEAKLERYDTNLDRYFVWCGNQYEPRDEYKRLLH